MTDHLAQALEITSAGEHSHTAQTQKPQGSDSHIQGRNPENIRYLAQYGSVAGRELAQHAKHGDPDALRQILGDLSAFLRGEKQLDLAFAAFCGDALEELVLDSDAWDRAAEEFRALDTTGASIQQILVRQGPRIPEKVRRRIASSFCRAFGLSRAQGRNAGEYNFLMTPDFVWKILYLRLYGASLPHATKIVRSAYKIKLSDRGIKEWFLRCSWLKIPEAGTHGFSCGQHPRRLMLAARVLHKTIRGMTADQAFAEVGETAVRELCFLPRATVFLKPEDVKAACDYAASCGDPRWDREQRFIRHLAKRNQSVDRPLPAES